MTSSGGDQRKPDRRAQDERIAAEPRLAPPQLPPGATAEPVEIHLARQGRRPLAVAGVVENGVVHLHKVTVVRDLGQEVEINSGVKQGDQVILNPAVDLAEGNKVRTRDAASQTT